MYVDLEFNYQYCELNTKTHLIVRVLEGVEPL